MSQNIVSFAKSLSMAGIRHVPTSSNNDKSPMHSVASFYDRNPMTDEECDKYYKDSQFIGIIGGKGIISVDFDYQGYLWIPFSNIMIKYYPSIWEKILYQEKSQSGGIHFIIRGPNVQCPKPAYIRFAKDKPDLIEEGKNYLCIQTKSDPVKYNKLLAHKEGNEYVVYAGGIEVKGEHGFLIVAPSTGYTATKGNLTNLGDPLTQDEWDILLSILVSLNQKPKAGFQYKTQPVVEPKTNSKTWNGISTFEDFNKRGEHVSILNSIGFEYLGDVGDRELWRRPGKNGGGSSATWHKSMRLFYNFSSNTPLLDVGGYNLSQLYTIFKHGGDYSSAAKELYNSENYGTKQGRIEDIEFEFPETTIHASPKEDEDESEGKTILPPSLSNKEIKHLVRNSILGKCIESVERVIPNIYPMMPIVGGTVLAACHLARRVRIGDEDSSFRPRVIGMNISGTTSGKGICSRAIIKAARLSCINRINEGSDKAYLLSLAKYPWGVLSVAEMNDYLEKGNPKRLVLGKIKEQFDADIVGSDAVTSCNIEIHNSAASCLFDLQPKLLFHHPSANLIIDGFFPRCFIAYDETVEPELIILKKPTQYFSANAEMISEAYEAHFGGLPKIMKPGEETIEISNEGGKETKKKTGRFCHPESQHYLKPEEYDSILFEKYYIPSNVQASIYRLYRGYLPILATCFETPANLEAGKITKSALEQADLLLLCGVHTQLKLINMMPNSLKECLPRKITDKLLSQEKGKTISWLKKFVRDGGEDFDKALRDAVNWGWVEKRRDTQNNRTYELYYPCRDKSRQTLHSEARQAVASAPLPHNLIQYIYIHNNNNNNKGANATNMGGIPPLEPCLPPTEPCLPPTEGGGGDTPPICRVCPSNSASRNGLDVATGLSRPVATVATVKTVQTPQCEPEPVVLDSSILSETSSDKIESTLSMDVIDKVEPVVLEDSKNVGDDVATTFLEDSILEDCECLNCTTKPIYEYDDEDIFWSRPRERVNIMNNNSGHLEDSL